MFFTISNSAAFELFQVSTSKKIYMNIIITIFFRFLLCVIVYRNE